MVIQDELDRMNRFVDDLLLLVRASRPDFLRPEPLDLDLLTHEVFAKARLLGDRAWVLEGTGIGLLNADPQRLTQAITNLASNAANHTGPGEPIWIGSALNDNSGPDLGSRRGPRDPGGGAAPDLRALRPLAERPGRRRCRPGPGHRRGDRRGTRRPRRAGLGARRRREVHDRDPGPVTRVLIAEDEVRLASFLEKGLRASGYTTTVAPDGPQASIMARDEDFDLLILDLGLPGKDGLEVLRELRSAGQRLPVIILTARDDPADKVAGLEAGADDYLAKPFHFEELLARVRARLRGDRPPEDSALRVGDISLDLRTRWASANGETIELSAREFELLRTFLQHPDQVLTREQLLSHVWGYDYDPGSNVVDVYVGYLRRKLGSRRFETVRGVGYRFRT